MAILVAGQIEIRPGQRDGFVRKSLEAVTAARETDGCDDFAISPDPIDRNRVNIFERWRSRAALDAFRGSGPGEDLSSLIERISVGEFEVPD